jgi:hypothetical protein
MDEERRRECQMMIVRRRIAAIVIGVAMIYGCVPLLLSAMDNTTRRRANEPALRLPLYKAMAVRGEIQPEMETTLPSKPAEHSDSPPLNIAWLMSFPNSGTSYTMRMIARTTQTLVATNYQKTESSEERRLHPVYAGNSEGPFWPDPEHSNYKRPPTYVLTKTHCGSRCNDCAPSIYLRDVNLDAFPTLCASGSKLKASPDGSEQVVGVEYNVTNVKRAIHLIRNPFDNVVSRFHLERHRMIKSNDTDKLRAFPDSREGFRNFCRHMNNKWKDEVESRWLTNEIGMLRDVPCRDDFFRYVIWHNLAFTTTDDQLRLPTYILYYEDYSDRFNETVTDLLDFLDLSQETEPYTFHKGHAYDDYFTADERQAVRAAAKIISSNTTWNNIKHYFW